MAYNSRQGHYDGQDMNDLGRQGVSDQQDRLLDNLLT